MFFEHLTLILSCLLLQVHAFRFSPPSDDTAFGINFGKHVGREEDRLNRYLWAGVRDSPYVVHDQKAKVITYRLPLRKRAQDPLIGFPNCLKCAGGARFNGNLDVDRDLTASILKRAIKPGGQDGQCLFYGQREVGAKPASLSGVASTLSCSWSQTNPKNGEKTRAIWDMWPKDESRACDKQTETSGYDYYCLNAWEPKCCWLNGLWGEGGKEIMENNIPSRDARELKTRPYFQQMSQAMAETCTGDVYVVHEHYDELATYQPKGQNPSIWISHELPALRRSQLRGILGKVWVIPVVPALLSGVEGLAANTDRSTWQDQTKVLNSGAARRYVEDHEGMALEWKMIREALRLQERQRASSPPNNSTQALEARWQTCRNSAAAREAKGADYFG